MARGVWDRMLNFLGFEEVEEDEAVAVAGDELAAVSPARDELARRRSYGRRSLFALPTTGRSWEGTGGAAGPRAGFTGASARRDGRRSEVRPGAVGAPRVPDMVVVVPRLFQEAQEMADHLRAGRPVILCLEGVDRELSQRLIQFLSGTVYALGGEMHRICSSAVLLVPGEVDVRLPVGLRTGGGLQ